MTDVLVRAFESTLHVRDDGDGRTLEGPVLPWGVEARVLDRGRLSSRRSSAAPWSTLTPPACP